MTKKEVIPVPALETERAAFAKRVIGQDEAVGEFAALHARLRSSIRPTRGPIDIKFLAGPSGVGKTEIVEAFADLLEKGGKDKIIKLNGGEFEHDFTVSRLFGSPPGYLGSEDKRFPEGGAKIFFSQKNLDDHRIFYTDKAGKRRSVVVILVDEAEKAHEALHRAMLEVLDKGRMTMANQDVSDFSNAVIFYTSNVGNAQAERMRLGLSDKGVSGVQIQAGAREIVEEAFRDSFPPEFRGRIKEILMFNYLDEVALRKITQLRLRDIEADFADNLVKILLNLSPEAEAWLVARGYNLSEGARSLQKVMKRAIQDPLILAHDAGSLHRKLLYVDVDPASPHALVLSYDRSRQLLDFTDEERSRMRPLPFAERFDPFEGTKPKPLTPERRKALLNMFYVDVGSFIEVIINAKKGDLGYSHKILNDYDLWNTIIVHIRREEQVLGRDHYRKTREQFVNAGIQTVAWWDKVVLNYPQRR